MIDILFYLNPLFCIICKKKKKRKRKINGLKGNAYRDKHDYMAHEVRLRVAFTFHTYEMFCSHRLGIIDVSHTQRILMAFLVPTVKALRN